MTGTVSEEEAELTVILNGASAASGVKNLRIGLHRSSRRSLASLGMTLGLALIVGCASVADPPSSTPMRQQPLGAGFRWSVYGPEYDPGPEYWALVGIDMARRFEGAVPETVWIVNSKNEKGALLNFPVNARDPLITGKAQDENEAILSLFDRLGFRVWLQIEPFYANVEELIHLVMSRYSHHPSVIGLGIDVEWYRSTDPDEGQAVTDAEATAWRNAVRQHGANYKLFLKHWEQEKMPPTVREGLVFVDDSQILPSLDAMVNEFAEWGCAFAPAPVAFQFGYPSDRPWWSKLKDPPREIGNAILQRVPNTAGLYWVDFTALDAFPPARRNPPIFFDDFTYSNVDDLTQNGWIIRTELGWPGVPGATWGKERLSLHDHPAEPGNRLLRMTSSTDGTGAKTRQSQFCHERKYLEGTYAARVRFTDTPVAGPNGDQIVETFYMISPLKEPMDLDYSETDFEYLPNGGWGHTGPTMFTTTWETFYPEPNWQADNVSANKAGSQEGWHTLVLQLGAGRRALYYLDGNLFAEHSGKFFPEVPMSINFNLWFVKDGLIKSGATRTWIEDIDWVFHQARAILTPAEVEARVAGMRARNVRFTDTVPDQVPPLPSPCNF